jgi:hypothetical protein
MFSKTSAAAVGSTVYHQLQAEQNGNHVLWKQLRIYRNAATATLNYYQMISTIQACQSLLCFNNLSVEDEFAIKVMK